MPKSRYENVHLSFTPENIVTYNELIPFCLRHCVCHNGRIKVNANHGFLRKEWSDSGLTMSTVGVNYEKGNAG